MNRSCPGLRNSIKASSAELQLESHVLCLVISLHCVCVCVHVYERVCVFMSVGCMSLCVCELSCMVTA